MKKITMPKLISTLLFVLFLFSNTYTQDSLKVVLADKFEGGSESFYSTLIPNLKYPRKARENCIMGATYTHLYLGKTGSIDSILFSRKLGFGIEKSIIKALESTAGKWNISEPLHLILFIGFEIGDNNDVKGDIMINAYKSVSGKRVNDCKTNKELLYEFTKLVKKEKYKKAKKKIDELLSRDPNSAHFNGLLDFVEDKME